MYLRILFKTKSNGFTKIKTFQLGSYIRARDVWSKIQCPQRHSLWIRDYKSEGKDRKRRVQIVYLGMFIILTLIMSYTPILDHKCQHTLWKNIKTLSVHFIWDPRSVRRFEISCDTLCNLIVSFFIGILNISLLLQWHKAFIRGCCNYANVYRCI